MKIDGYQIVSTALLEMETGKLLNRGRKILWRGVKNDKYKYPLVAVAALPGGSIPAVALHAIRNKRSRDVARVMGRKVGQELGILKKKQNPKTLDNVINPSKV